MGAATGRELTTLKVGRTVIPYEVALNFSPEGRRPVATWDATPRAEAKQDRSPRVG